MKWSRNLEERWRVLGWTRVEAMSVILYLFSVIMVMVFMTDDCVACWLAST